MGEYADVNGVRLYIEQHGDKTSKATPLVLLHGGIGGIEMFGPNIAALAKDRRAIGVDLQGHARTRDINRPLRHETMADDIAALADYLGLASIDVMGYSLGGGVALQLAIRHPRVVRRLVIIGRAIAKRGYFPEIAEAFEKMGPHTAANMKHSPLYKMYPDVDWPTLFTKTGEMERRDYDWSADVARISAPIMWVFADADMITPSHLLEIWSLFGGGQHDAGLDGSKRPRAQLAVIPGTTHYNILRTTVVADLARPFLDN
jgi:pimeloyl-ACP methyl ester carboxylesterase